MLTAIAFDDEAEAVAIANDVRYGLAGYLWTATSASQPRRAALDAHDLGELGERATCRRRSAAKASGIGRDGGDYSFDFYMETKNVALALGAIRSETGRRAG